MGSFHFISKVKKVFRGNNEPRFNSNYDYSQAEIGKTYTDQEAFFSYGSPSALAIECIVVDMQKELTVYYEKKFNSRKEAKKTACNYITQYIDPIAKCAEKDETSRRDFLKIIVDVYKTFEMKPTQSTLQFLSLLLRELDQKKNTRL